jgi:ATP-dependent DNA helicase RecQ
MDQRFHSAINILQRAGYVQRIQSADGPGVRILKPGDRHLSSFNFADLEQRRAFERRKLAMMLQYASRFRKHCYRSFVLRYFGEWTKVKDCGNCSRCAPKKQLDLPQVKVEVTVVRAGPAKTTPNAEAPKGIPDSTVIALKVLSCILRASEQVGREKIARILAGSNDSSIRIYQGLTTYGILSGYSIRAIVSMIDYLIGEGYIDGGDGFRPVIRVTEKGRQFLRDRPAIVIPGA